MKMACFGRWAMASRNDEIFDVLASKVRGFFFFIFKKIEISKIYVGFGKFQKYTPVALWGATGLKCNFFLQICNEVPGEKKR